MKLYFKALALFLVFVSLVLAGWTLNWESIEKNMSQVKSISGTFTQKKNLKILTRPLISKGRLYYLSPDSIRWEYTSPIKSILLVNKGNVKRFIMKDNKLIEDSSARLEAVRIVVGQITEWFAGRFNGNKDFKAEIIEGKVVLTPQNATIKNFIQKVVITFSKNDGVISSIEIIEVQEGASISLEFGDIEINKPLPDGIFEKIK
jgi:outer membrane lipoprotein carrier protein